MAKRVCLDNPWLGTRFVMRPRVSRLIQSFSVWAVSVGAPRKSRVCGRLP